MKPSIAYGNLSKDYQKFEVWYPAEMKDCNSTYPLVVMTNGTGVKESQYKEVFKHLASWRFIAVGNEDENSRTVNPRQVPLTLLLSLMKIRTAFFTEI